MTDNDDLLDLIPGCWYKIYLLNGSEMHVILDRYSKDHLGTPITLHYSHGIGKSGLGYSIPIIPWVAIAYLERVSPKPPTEGD